MSDLLTTATTSGINEHVYAHFMCQSPDFRSGDEDDEDDTYWFMTMWQFVGKCNRTRINVYL